MFYELPGKYNQAIGINNSDIREVVSTPMLKKSTGHRGFVLPAFKSSPLPRHRADAAAA